jgi:hypothetical protein
MQQINSALRVLPAIALSSALCLAAWPKDTPVYFSPQPGPARALLQPDGFEILNAAVSLKVQISAGHVKALQFRNLVAPHQPLATMLPFALLLGDGHIVIASSMQMTAVPRVTDLRADANASRLSERVPGKAVIAEFEDESSHLQVTWLVVLRDGSNCVRQDVSVTAASSDVPVREVRLLDWQSQAAHVIGTVHGSPVVDGLLFAGFEDPLSSCAVAAGRARCWVERELPLKVGQSLTYSSVVGVASDGQLRRSFLRYVERERAHPYRTFLNYNSWYDLGYFSKYNEADALQVINTFGTELTRKRGVPIQSFLFDDGWDNPATLWHFNSGFPNGFTKLKEAAAQYGTAPGVWMSPWGGYGKPKQQRVEAGKQAGYEVVNSGFALSGPRYYAAFRDTCVEFIHDYGVNQFKFDGTGNADRVVSGSSFDSDFSAAIHLIGELRALNPDLYINLTTGTYPSPFWLRYADSIWRGGEDHDFLGVGSKREQWITYRDAQTYEHVVLSGPLFPLNSLMLHGIIYARSAHDLNSDPEGDFKGEVRDYFGNGTQLQEMYITPAMLSQTDWDNIAEAAAWSHANADVLVDTHWIGGDPALLEVYGWASWSPQKAIIVLRNPSNKPQTIDLELEKAFELSPRSATTYVLHSPWREDRGQPVIRVAVGERHRFALSPFQVAVLEGEPIN